MACSFVPFHKSLLQRAVMLTTLADRPYTKNELLQSLPKPTSRAEPKQEHKRLFALRSLSFWEAGNDHYGPVPQVLVLCMRV